MCDSAVFIASHGCELRMLAKTEAEYDNWELDP